MRYKPLALRVLSTAAMLSIVASCAAPAFAATYDLGENGDVSSARNPTVNSTSASGRMMNIPTMPRMTKAKTSITWKTITSP